jgi:hypothetical protein
MFGLFKKKPSYRDIVRMILKDASEVDLRMGDSFDGFTFNTLEALVVVFWMVERSFWALPQPKHEKAGEFALEILLNELRDDYTPEEMKSFVIPCFWKRTDEYSALFTLKAGQESSAALMQVCQRMVANITGRSDPGDTLPQILTAATYWFPSITGFGNILADLDREGSVSW